MNSIATRYIYVLDLLEDLVHNRSSKSTNLIICSTREEFLGQILSGLRPQSGTSEAASHHDEVEGEDASCDDASLSGQIFLSPVLSLLNASQFIKLVFCPTIPSLRAYFSSCVGMPTPTTLSKPTEIIILNLLGQHHGSSEFTFQGLSQTLATIISAGSRMRQPVQLVECKDINDPSNTNFGSTLWNAEVPLLSMSIKIGEGGAIWGRRTVEVQKIASRWFKMEKSTDHGKASRAVAERTEIPDSEDEMLV
jgi:hypothetical protein